MEKNFKVNCYVCRKKGYQKQTFPKKTLRLKKVGQGSKVAVMLVVRKGFDGNC